MNWEDLGIDIPHGRTSGNIKTFCPRCRESRSNKHDRSLSVNLTDGVFHCHYCGWSGGINEKEKDYFKMEKSYIRPSYKNVTKLSDKLVEYFESRKITQSTLKEMKITEGLEFMPQKGVKCNTVQFNYFENGELVNVKYRTGDKCFKLAQGAELIPYNIDSILDSKECVITEGEFDALSYITCGYKTAVSVPNGANSNLSYLDRFIDSHFEDKETIYVASDSDKKGLVLREELIRRFGAERCKIVEYGEGCKDANEHLIKYGSVSLLETLKNAREIKIDGVFTVKDFEQSLDTLFEKGMQKGVTIGHENFDNLCSFETKRLCVVTGVPGSGKSEFIDEIAERLNVLHDWKFAYFSPENAPLQYHASKIISKITGKQFDNQHLSYNEYKQVKEYMEDNFFFLGGDDFTLDSILDKAKYLVRRRGIKSLVIDPWNRVESNIPPGTSETNFISKQLDKMTIFAQKHDVLVILMAHPTKMKKNKETNDLEVPTLYDINGSANFYNKCDFGLVVNRRGVDNLVDVYVRKVKFRHLGEPGVAVFKYNINNGRYSPYNEMHPEKLVWDNDNHLVNSMKKREMEAQSSFVFDPEDFDKAPF